MSIDAADWEKHMKVEEALRNALMAVDKAKSLAEADSDYYSKAKCADAQGSLIDAIYFLENGSYRR